MLLLHQQNTARALAQFKDHLKLLKKVPPQRGEAASPVAQAAHLGWVCRQFAVMADQLHRSAVPEGVVVEVLPVPGLQTAVASAQ